MPDGDNAHQAFGRRIFVQRDIAGLAAGDDQLTKARMASQPSSDLGVGIEYQDRAAYFVDVIECRSGIGLEVELKDPFEIIERFFRNNNHGCFRGLGRSGFSPVALLSR